MRCMHVGCIQTCLLSICMYVMRMCFHSIPTYVRMYKHSAHLIEWYVCNSCSNTFPVCVDVCLMALKALGIPLVICRLYMSCYANCVRCTTCRWHVYIGNQRGIQTATDCTLVHHATEALVYMERSFSYQCPAPTYGRGSQTSSQSVWGPPETLGWRGSGGAEQTVALWPHGCSPFPTWRGGGVDKI